MESEEKRQTILDAFGEIILEKGFSSVTTEDLAASVSMSKQDIYAQFGSKRMALETVISDYSEGLCVHISSKTPETLNEFLQCMRDFGEQFLTGILEPRRVAYYRQAIAEAHISSYAQVLSDNGIELVRERVKLFVKNAAIRGLIKPERAASGIEVFMVMLTGQVQTQVLLGLLEPPSQEIIAKRADNARNLLEMYLRCDL